MRRSTIPYNTGCLVVVLTPSNLKMASSGLRKFFARRGSTLDVRTAKRTENMHSIQRQIQSSVFGEVKAPISLVVA